MGQPDTAPKVEQPTAAKLPELVERAVVASEGEPPTLQLFIAGEWRSATSGETFEIRSPIDGNEIAVAQAAGEDDVEAAIDAAFAARSRFREMAAAERIEICERAAEIMTEHFDAFVHTIVVDLGKTPSQAKSEVTATRERLALVREEARKIFGEYLPGDWIPDTKGKSGIVLREPVGTVAAIGPFNYPLFLTASKIIPAIAAGNTVVAKAPSDDPIVLTLFVSALEEAGLPPGVLNLVTGRGGEIGDRFASHDAVSMVSFTGSAKVGRRLAELAGPKPLHLELGGNAAAIVLADADLELAVKKSVDGAFKNAGQRCDAVSRVLVEEAVYDDYLEQAVDQARGYTMGDPRADGVDVGPLVNERAVASVQELVSDAVEKGARMLAGGGSEGSYHEPTVLAEVPLEAEIVWEETFGPVLTIVPVRDLGAALEVANKSRYGLDSCIFSSDLDRAWAAARALECGMVTINDAPAHGVGHFPFGGRKPDSGIGREGLGYSIDECTALKTVVLPS
jgi:acyl-CoA reductase-like NAD-dependent aldehyde dehydrogenase